MTVLVVPSLLVRTSTVAPASLLDTLVTLVSVTTSTPSWTSSFLAVALVLSMIAGPSGNASEQMRVTFFLSPLAYSYPNSPANSVPVVPAPPTYIDDALSYIFYQG